VNQALTRAAAGALGFIYAVAWAVAGWLWTGPLSDLDYFFFPAVRIALSGHPLLVYAVRFKTIIANDNGPLGLVPLTAVAAVASQLGWLDDARLRRGLVLGTLSIFTVLMAREGVAAIDRVRGAKLRGRSRILAYSVFAASPTLFIGVLGYGHVEQPMMLWLVLLGVRCLANGRPKAAGISLGLAMLTRSLAAISLIPLGLLLLARGRWRAAIGFAGSAVLTVALGVLPFAVADPKDTVYSLLTHRGNLPVGGGSIWQLVVGTPYEWVPQRADIVFILGLAVLASLIVIRARQDLEPSSPDVYGLLALTALTLPLLAKSVWPYYFVDAYVFGAVWWLGQASPLAWGRRLLGAMVPLIATVGTVLTENELGASDARIRLPEGVAMGLLLAVSAAVLGIRLRRRGPAQAPLK
jgi:glycosyl transferase family 87